VARAHRADLAAPEFAKIRIHKIVLVANIIAEPVLGLPIFVAVSETAEVTTETTETTATTETTETTETMEMLLETTETTETTEMSEMALLQEDGEATNPLHQLANTLETYFP